VGGGGTCYPLLAGGDGGLGVCRHGGGELRLGVQALACFNNRSLRRKLKRELLASSPTGSLRRKLKLGLLTPLATGSLRGKLKLGLLTPLATPE